MRYNQIKNVNYLKERRRELRNNLTPAEAALWRELKGSALGGRKFRRQHSIENYIVDFYCPQEKLVIELDGEVHNDPMQAEYDTARSERLKLLGNKILRFENNIMFNDMEGVLRTIQENFDSESTTLSPPKNRRGTHYLTNKSKPIFMYSV